MPLSIILGTFLKLHYVVVVRWFIFSDLLKLNLESLQASNIRIWFFKFVIPKIIIRFEMNYY